MTNVADQAVARAASMRFTDYDPSKVIEAVNELRVLGKDGALEQVNGYLASHRDDDSYGLFWVLRVLFDVPADPGFPPVSIGQPSIPPPADPATLPRFPIAIVRDVPLLVVDGYTLGGLPQGVEDHVAYFREHGTIREEPLTPPASAEGLEDEFLELWRTAYGEAHTRQALATIGPQLAKL